MASKPITSDELIAAAKRLRRRGIKKEDLQHMNTVMSRDIINGINSFGLRKTTKAANDYIMTELDRFKKDVSATLDTYFSLGSRLNKGYQQQYREDYTSNEKLQDASIKLMGVLDDVNDAISFAKSNKSISTKDIETAADKTEDQMKDLIKGLQDDLNDVFKLASKIGNRDVMNAIEVLNGVG